MSEEVVDDREYEEEGEGGEEEETAMHRPSPL